MGEQGHAVPGQGKICRHLIVEQKILKYISKYVVSKLEFFCELTLQ